MSSIWWRFSTIFDDESKEIDLCFVDKDGKKKCRTYNLIISLSIINLNKIKYIPKLLSAQAFLLLLILFAILFLGRHNQSLRIQGLLKLFPDFYTHASNLCISYVLVSSVGYLWLMLGARMMHIGYLASVLIVANIICEFWVSWGNVPDVMDACYGFVGVAVAVGFLWVVKLFGMRVAK